MNTEKMFEVAYKESDKYYNQLVEKNNAIKNMINSGWNKSSAQMTISIYKALMKGKIYKWNMPKLQTDIFLNNILREYKEEGLKKALNSVKGNIKYYEEKGINKIAIKEVYEKYSNILMACK